MTVVVYYSMVNHNPEMLRDFAKTLGIQIDFQDLGGLKTKFKTTPNLTTGQKTRLANMLKGITQDYTIT